MKITSVLALKGEAAPLLLTEMSDPDSPAQLPLHPQALEHNKRIARHNFEHVQAVLLHITAIQDSYLAPRDLAALGIRLSHLNLRTGDCSDGDQQFLRPYNPHLLDGIISRNAPWKVHKMPSPKNNVNFGAAMEVGDMLEAYMSLAHNPNDEVLMRSTAWMKRDRKLPFENELYSRGDGADWEAKFIMECKDISYPHMAVFLADGVPMRENNISRTELETALAVMADRMKMPEYYEKHRIVPVTVFSTASRKLRILQVFYSKATNLITIRKSSVIDFEREHVATTKRVLSWLVAHPIGDTEHERIQVQTGMLAVQNRAVRSLARKISGYFLGVKS